MLRVAVLLAVAWMLAVPASVPASSASQVHLSIRAPFAVPAGSWFELSGEYRVLSGSGIPIQVSDMPINIWRNGTQVASTRTDAQGVYHARVLLPARGDYSFIATNPRTDWLLDEWKSDHVTVRGIVAPSVTAQPSLASDQWSQTRARWTLDDGNDPRALVEVWRKENNWPLTRVATLAPSVSEFRMNALPNASYVFEIRVSNEVGGATATITGVTPSAPIDAFTDANYTAGIVCYCFGSPAPGNFIVTQPRFHGLALSGGAAAAGRPIVIDATMGVTYPCTRPPCGSALRESVVIKKEVPVQADGSWDAALPEAQFVWSANQGQWADVIVTVSAQVDGLLISHRDDSAYRTDDGCSPYCGGG